MRKFLFIFFAAIGLILSCKKPKKADDSLINSSGELEMKRLTQQLWIAYKLEVEGTDVWNFQGVLKECQKDDTYRFYKDSTLMRYENSKICVGGSDSAATSWQFYEGRKKVIATVIGITDTADIVSLEDESMQLRVLYDGYPALISFKKN